MSKLPTAITSLQNPKLKLLLSLASRAARNKSGLFVVEGVRLAEEAARFGENISFGLFTPELLTAERGAALIDALRARRVTLYETTDKIMARASEVETSQGIILVVAQNNRALDELKLSANPLLIVLDRVQDPGNVGAILRIADAAGVDAVIAVRGTADIFGGKAIRSAMGAQFHLPIVKDVALSALADFFQAQKITAYAGLPAREAMPFYAADYNRAAVIFGNEGGGIDESLAARSVAVHIPMYGRAESLNVSTAAAIIVYEALRRRHGWG